jgi:hypothetical protein
MAAMDRTDSSHHVPIRASMGLLALLALAACGAGPCEDEIFGELPSPDGTYVAALMTRECDEGSPIAIDGRDTLFAKAVLMRSADAEDFGDDPLAGAIHIVDGDWPIAIRWINPSWFGIDSDNPPDKLIRWSPSDVGLVIVYE